ncbi:hypothetical protein BDZ91DRAFT_731760 [Kalaharituber pfeilii]|nr:hypothetical protein BDZ91DRAFT_731760 [Kalaharituber pfeilii]
MHKKIAYTKYYMTVLNYGSSHSQVAIEEVAEMSESAGNAETTKMSLLLLEAAIVYTRNDRIDGYETALLTAALYTMTDSVYC